MFGSALAHGLLLVLLVVSSAFVNPKPKEEDVKFIKLFPGAEMTDAETSGGGNPLAVSTPVSEPTPAPAAPPAPAPAAQPAPQPAAKPPEVKPPPAKPKEILVKSKPETAKTVKKPAEPKKIVESKPEPVKPKVAEKPKIEVDLTTKVAAIDPELIRRKTERAEKLKREAQEAREAQERAEAEAREQERAYELAITEAKQKANQLAAARAAAVASAVGTLQSKISGRAMVEMPGPGGKAFANYIEYVWSKYYAAWQTPEARGGATSVKVEIVVARDGRVMSAKIINKSGNAALDKSVSQALERVPALPPFPEGTPDQTRTFRINFTLEAKRQLG